jgi:hypothetical protein
MNHVSPTLIPDEDSRKEVSVDPVPTITDSVELKLSAIIAAARRIAVLAEEILRDTATTATVTQKDSVVHSSPDMAVRLLTATEQQLNSLLGMSQQD